MDYKPGDEVRYIPQHAHGNWIHEDCEDGIVFSVKSEVVFVRYYAEGRRIITGHETPRATNPGSLILLKKRLEP